jgi:cytochrome c5
MKILNLKNVIASVTVLAVAFCLVSFEMGWVVPAADAAVKNPVKSTPASISAGKVVYLKTCKMCHGATGVGVGKMADPANFTSKEFKAQTDGAIFYKINVGYQKMPGYKAKIKEDNERWNLVNYLRTL